MKVHLVFPPIWVTEIPYLSLPALKAYLKEASNVEARSLDLNIQLWRHLRSESSLSDLFTWGKGKVDDFGVLRSREDLDAVLRLRAILNGDLDSLVQKVKMRRIPVPVLQSCLKMYFQEVVMGQDTERFRRWQQDRDYHDPYMNSISLSELATTSQKLLGSLQMSEKKNPYLRLMPMLYRQLVGDELPDLLGLSVTAVNQVVPALALSHWMRLTKPECRIVWGGQWVTHVLDQPQELAPLFDIVDGLVAGEGEKPLSCLIRCEAEGQTWNAVPNLFRRVGTEVIGPHEVYQSPDLNHLPVPDFTGIPLDEYDYPQTLPLQTSRGCSWNHCRFCSYVILDRVYKKRAVEKVVDDIEAIIARHPVREIAFTDAIMEPPHFLALADELLCRGVRIKWRGFGRFDRRFTAKDLGKLGRAGCNFIIWGMESGSDRILQLMKKGTNREIARQNLWDAAKAGIHNRVCLMYGYATETVKDRDLTTSFLRDNLNAVHSMAFSPLSVERGTPLAVGPETKSLEGVSTAKDLELEVPRHPSSSTLIYLRETEQELREIYLELERR